MKTVERWEYTTVYYDCARGEWSTASGLLRFPSLERALNHYAQARYEPILSAPLNQIVLRRLIHVSEEPIEVKSNDR